VGGNEIEKGTIDTAKPLVKISLPRVLEVLGETQELERQCERPGAIILYTMDDRLEKMFKALKKRLRNYEAEEGVRLDIYKFEEDTPDFTDDFIEKMNNGDFWNVEESEDE
jgi:hypothetical protein